MNVNVNDRLTLKKKHPCGAFEWDVLRVGADFKIKCRTCGALVMIPREKIEKNIKKINGMTPQKEVNK